MDWSRRQFLTAAGVGTTSAALASCSGGGGSSSSGGDTLTFTLWGGDAEIAAFTAIADAYKAAHGVTVKLQNLPYAQILTNVDSKLQSGNPPDLFRVSYIDIGQYTSVGALADISGQLPSGFADEFTPALWKAVLDPKEKPVGVPHHTDVSALVYNVEAFKKAGIAVPTTLEGAWTWDQFTQVLTEVKGANGHFPVAVNWQAAGAYRWLSFLAQAGGSVFDDSGKKVTIASDAGHRALTYTKGLYTSGLHDPTFLVQAANYPDEAFPTQQISSVYTGDFNLPSLDSTVKDFTYGATFLPRDVSAATDLGGNAVVVPADGKNVEEAAKFAAFLASKEQMQAFCEKTTVLPTRKDLVGASLDYSVRPDLMPVFVQQATTIPESLVATSTSTNFSKINAALQQELEACFAKGTSVDDTLDALSTSIEKAANS
jgi:multiple sugar transport system substrate-binding protein